MYMEPGAISSAHFQVLMLRLKDFTLAGRPSSVRGSLPWKSSACTSTLWFTNADGYHVHSSPSNISEATLVSSKYLVPARCLVPESHVAILELSWVASAEEDTLEFEGAMLEFKRVVSSPLWVLAHFLYDHRANCTQAMKCTYVSHMHIAQYSNSDSAPVLVHAHIYSTSTYTCNTHVSCSARTLTLWSGSSLTTGGEYYNIHVNIGYSTTKSSISGLYYYGLTSSQCTTLVPIEAMKSSYSLHWGATNYSRTKKQREQASVLHLVVVSWLGGGFNVIFSHILHSNP